MSDSEFKPIYTLTTEEYVNLTKSLILEVVESILDKKEKEKSSNKKETDIIFIDEVLALTGYRKATLYSKVCRFEIPVLSRRKPLTFSRSQIMKWLEDGKPGVFDMQAEEYLLSKRNARR